MAAITSCSVDVVLNSAARELNVVRRRSPMTRSVSSDTTHKLPCYAAILPVQRAIRERVIGLFAIAASFEEKQQGLIPRRLARAEHSLDPGPHIVPNLRPHFARWLPSAQRVLLSKRHPCVGVVVKERQFRAPSHPHGEAGSEHDPDNGFQALRPGLTIS